MSSFFRKKNYITCNGLWLALTPSPLLRSTRLDLKLNKILYKKKHCTVNFHKDISLMSSKKVSESFVNYARREINLFVSIHLLTVYKRITSLKNVQEDLSTAP